MTVRVVARVGGFRSPRQRFFAVSFVLHVAGAAALIILPSLRGTRATFDDPIIVQLAAPPAPRAAAPEPRPASAPVARPPEPKPQPPKEDVTVQPEPKKSEEIVKPAEPEPQEEPPIPSSAQPEAYSGSPAEHDLGAEGGELASISPLEGGDEAFAWYRASVTAALYTRWQRPMLSGLTEPVEVRVVFAILRDGTVIEARVESSSGVPALDRSALRAIADASPLPALPNHWSEPTLPAVFVFRLFPEEI